MSVDPSARIRLLVIVGVLAAAALAAGVLLFGRAEAGESGSAGAAAGKRAQPRVGPARHRAGRAAAQRPSAGLPAAVARALDADRVVVVSLYAPQAKLDATALREADAGAALAGAAFVAIDVTKSAVDGLNKRYGVMQDPAVLVLRPPAGDLIVRIDGFADRDTVAQAAVNAAS